MLDLRVDMYQEYYIDVSSGKFDNLKKEIEAKNPAGAHEYIDDRTIEELNKIVKGCQQLIVEFPYYDREYLSSYYGHWSERFKAFSKKSYRVLFFADKNCKELMGYITLNPTFSKSHIGKMYFDPQYFINEKAKVILSTCKVHFNGREEQIKLFPALRQIDPCVCAHVAVWGIVKYKSKWHEYAEKTSFEIENNIPKEWITNKLLNGVSVSQMAQILYEQRNYPIIKHISDKYSHKFLFEETFAYIQSKTPVILLSEKIDHAVVCMGYGSFCFAKSRTNDIMAYQQMFRASVKNQLQQPLLIHASELVGSFFVNDDLFFPYREIPIGVNEFTTTKMDSHSCENEKNDSEQANFPEYAIEVGSDLSGLIAPLYDKIKLNYDFAKEVFLDLIDKKGVEYGWIRSNDDSAAYIYNLFIISCYNFRSHMLSVLTDEDNDEWKKIYNILSNVEVSRFVWVCEISSPDEFDKNEIRGFVILDSTTTLGDAAIPLIIFGPKKIMYYDNNHYVSILDDPKIVTENPDIVADSFNPISKFSNDLNSLN